MRRDRKRHENGRQQVVARERQYHGTRQRPALISVEREGCGVKKRSYDVVLQSTRQLAANDNQSHQFWVGWRSDSIGDDEVAKVWITRRTAGKEELGESVSDEVYRCQRDRDRRTVCTVPWIGYTGQCRGALLSRDQKWSG